MRPEEVDEETQTGPEARPANGPNEPAGLPGAIFLPAIQTPLHYGASGILAWTHW